MKKILSLVLAVLMLALPVFSVAEGVQEMAAAALRSEFAAKYMLQGQALTTDVTIEPGIVLLAAVPEDYQAAVQDLLSALTIRGIVQATEGQGQAGLVLRLNDEDALDARVAAVKSGIYVDSSLLGGKILRVTPAQLKGLAKQQLAQMVAEGQITQEQVDALAALWKEFRADPVGTLVNMIGEVNTDALLSAFMPILMGAEQAEVTEAPEALPDATMMITIPMTKEALNNVAGELAHILWNMPITQQMAALFPVNGETLTEEKLVEESHIFDVMAEDTVVNVYANEAGSMLMVFDLKLADGEETVDAHYEALLKMKEDGAILSYSMDLGEKGSMLFTADVTLQGEDVLIAGQVDMDMKDQGTASETIDMKLSMGDTVHTVDGTVTVNVNVAGQNVTAVSTVAAEEKDLGDHAEETATVRISVDGIGDVLTMNVNAKTDLAEAYIITPDAVEPLGLEGEEQQAVLSELYSSAMTGLFSAIPKLPESVQQLIMGSPAGQE